MISDETLSLASVGGATVIPMSVRFHRDRLLLHRKLLLKQSAVAAPHYGHTLFQGKKGASPPRGLIPAEHSRDELLSIPLLMARASSPSPRGSLGKICSVSLDATAVCPLQSFDSGTFFSREVLQEAHAESSVANQVRQPESMQSQSTFASLDMSCDVISHDVICCEGYCDRNTNSLGTHSAKVDASAAQSSAQEQNGPATRGQRDTCSLSGMAQVQAENGALLRQFCDLRNSDLPVDGQGLPMWPNPFQPARRRARRTASKATKRLCSDDSDSSDCSSDDDWRPDDLHRRRRELHEYSTKKAR